MANPTKYTQSYDFSEFQESNPSSPLPGPQVDIQLADIELSIDETVDALADVRRSDGALKNGIVTAESLAVDIMADVDAAVTAAQLAEAHAEIAETNAETAAAVATAAAAGTAGAVALAQANAVLAQDAQHAAEFAKIGALGAQSGAERARDDALDAQVAAAASAIGLSAAVVAAELAETHAETAEANAETAQAAAEDARDDALSTVTSLDAALAALAGSSYLLDWGPITVAAGVSNDWGSIA